MKQFNQIIKLNNYLNKSHIAYFIQC